MNPVDEIVERLNRYGGADYGGERVTQLAHALPCAALAEEEGADATLISAALLHDIGHLVHDLGPTPAARGIDDRHETRGEEWLARWFGEAVTPPVRLHVDAKRYLTATDPGYFASCRPDRCAASNCRAGRSPPNSPRGSSAPPIRQRRGRGA